MSSTLPMGVDLLNRLEDELGKMGVDLTPQASAAIEREFTRRVQASPDPNATLHAWDLNLPNYVGALDRIAREHRRALQQPDDSRVTLDVEQVQRTFAICGRLCPGPV